MERPASHNVLQVNLASTDMSSRFSVTVPRDYHRSTSPSASEEMLALKKRAHGSKT
jgi:hypothetical protein